MAHSVGPAGLGVILTGMGDDGVSGLLELRSAGGLVFAQDEESSVVYGMPKEAAAQGAVDRVLALDRGAPAIRHALSHPEARSLALA